MVPANLGPVLINQAGAQARLGIVEQVAANQRHLGPQEVRLTLFCYPERPDTVIAEEPPKLIGIMVEGRQTQNHRDPGATLAAAFTRHQVGSAIVAFQAGTFTLLSLVKVCFVQVVTYRSRVPSTRATCSALPVASTATLF